MTASSIIRTIRAGLAELPAGAASRPKVEQLAANQCAAERRRTDYAARGRAAWATRQKASRRRG